MTMQRAKVTMVLGALVIVAGVGTAAEESATGSATYIPVHSKAMELANGDTSQITHLKGVILADDPSVSLHLAMQDCVGTTVIPSDGGPPDGAGYCAGTDANGDLWWIWWHNGPGGNLWGFIGGTGKYKGIEGGGTTEQQVMGADGRMAITWKGSWKMK